MDVCNSIAFNVTKEEREVREVFIMMLKAHEGLSPQDRKKRYLQTTKVVNWLSKKVRFGGSWRVSDAH